MGRLGLTREDVDYAYRVLVKQGVYPSAARIREFIGSGSIGTIHNFLRDIRRGEPVPLNESEGISVAIDNAVSEAVVADASAINQDLRGLVTEFVATTDHMHKLSKKIMAELLHSESELRQKELELAKAQAQIQSLQKMMLHFKMN
jgi:hypothetical protein